MAGARTREGRPARYQALAGALRADIRAGRLKPGDAMPTEHELAQAHGVSRFTVREALRHLEDDGLIRRRRGSGTVVTADSPRLRQGFADTAALLQYAARSTFRFAIEGLVTLRPADARLLKRPEGEARILIRGTRVMDGAVEPIALTEVWIDPALGALVAQLEEGHEALFSQLERLGAPPVERVAQEIAAVGLTAEQGRILHVPARSPALRIVRHYHAADGTTPEISCSIHPSERFSYMMEIRR